MIWQIPLSDLDYGPEEAAAVRRVLQNKWLSLGPETGAFEEEFAAYTGTRHAIAVANGTAALHLAFLALGIGSGDEIIQPAVNFVAAANMSKAVGATPVFGGICGLEEPTLDPLKVERLITPRTKAVVVMHYGGYFCRMAEILALCQKHRLALVEDACHAVGADYSDEEKRPPHGCKAGNLGDIGCFSFFSNKNLVTGEGGMVTTNRDEIAERIRSLRSHGMTSLTWDRHRGHATQYDVLAHGYNYRLDDLRSALGREQLKKLERNNQRRRELTALYWRKLEPLEAQGWTLSFKRRASLHPQPASFNSACHLLAVVAPDANTRSRCVKRLAQAGIQTSLHYPLIPGLSAFAGSPGWVTEKAAGFCQRVITLPLYPTMTQNMVERVCAELLAPARNRTPSRSGVKVLKPALKVAPVLITGAGSFTGTHLAKYLSSLSVGPIVGADLTEGVGGIPIVRFQRCDIRNGAEVRELLESVRPEVVYHLAASGDENDPEGLFRANIEGAWHVLNACRQLQEPRPRVLLVGSAAGYGEQPVEVATLQEDMPTCPNTLYGFSREAELALGQLARRRWGLPVFLCRPFNLVGPGLSERYAPAAILRRLLALSRAETTLFPLRNRHAIRDFLDVRDAVRAYYLILKQGRPGVIYNIGCGRGVGLTEVTQQLARLVGRSIRITEGDGTQALDRSEAGRSIANHDRLTRDTGWRPEIPLEQSLADMVRELGDGASETEVP
jgi:dTDP-4-amino-4,6-dideoxygalactose transaminase/nucleoside-diphosphate-sugar epimerase